MNQPATENRNTWSFNELLAWAWQETPPVHKHRVNLLIHVIAVPGFVLGHAVALIGLFTNPWWVLAGLLIALVSYGAQGIGHALEQTAPPPFQGPKDFVRRVYAEQGCNFWRFLASGQWWASLKAARAG